MSAFGRYIWETRGVKIVESIHGFATYLVSGEECYVEDVYVEVDQRGKGIARKLIDEVSRIAKDLKCNCLTTTVNGRFTDPDTSLKSCLAYGFKLHKIADGIILLKMEI